MSDIATFIAAITEFRDRRRARAKVPGSDIRQRWESRIIAQKLHTHGHKCAGLYLRNYGKGIGEDKLVAFAIQAEMEGCDDVGIGFWTAAFCLGKPFSELGMSVDQITEAFAGVEGVEGVEPRSAPTVPARASAEDTLGIAELPKALQPGRIITMQPVDASFDRTNYIEDPVYIGEPKRDGERCVVIATPAGVQYQSRSTNLTAAPGSSQAWDATFQAVARSEGHFILDCECTYLDAAGGEHRTGAQAATTNAALGKPAAAVRCCMVVFKALFARGFDLTEMSEDARIIAAVRLVAVLTPILAAQGDPDLVLEMIPVARTTLEKRALVAKQQAEGREGEVWIDRTTTYIGGKAGGEAIVRTKYLTETEVVVVGFTATTVAGRPFGAIEVAERQADGSLRPVGRVGSGFSAADAADLVEREARHPSTRIVVRHQGRTETGILWHARFLRVSACSQVAA